MQGQRCPLCGAGTAQFDRRLGCWACRCGWTDRRLAPRAPLPRQVVLDDAYARSGEEEGIFRDVAEGLLPEVDDPRPGPGRHSGV
jgi:hypothetical protein